MNDSGRLFILIFCAGILLGLGIIIPVLLSNKTSNCVEDDTTNQKIEDDYMKSPEDDLTSPEDDLTSPEDDLTSPEDDIDQSGIQSYVLPYQEIYVWTYWDGVYSDLVNTCIERINQSCIITNTYSSTNIIYKHIHLTSYNIKTYLPNLDVYNSRIRGEYIGFLLLLKYGGIWIDSSVFIYTTMNDLFPVTSGPNFLTYYNIDPLFSIVENYAIFATPGHPLLESWFSQLNGVLSNNIAQLSYNKIIQSHNIGRCFPGVTFINNNRTTSLIKFTPSDLDKYINYNNSNFLSNNNEYTPNIRQPNIASVTPSNKPTSTPRRIEPTSTPPRIESNQSIAKGLPKPKSNRSSKRSPKPKSKR